MSVSKLTRTNLHNNLRENLKFNKFTRTEFDFMAMYIGALHFIIPLSKLNYILVL
jgi:hypothetical protein